jgi:hypothetical protein
MGDSAGPFIRDLAATRARNVAERVQKLVAAGVPYERLFLVSDPTCECSGLGIIIEQSEHCMRGYECPSCLGVGMVAVGDTTPAERRSARLTL